MASEYTAEEALTATALVTGVLDRLSVPYLVAGSLASSAYGFPRSTHDADLVADLRPHHVAPFVQGLEGRFYADRERIAHGVERRTSFNLIYLPTSFRVDVFLQQPGDAARREMERRRRVSIGGHELALAAPSDVVVHKLVWYRQGGQGLGSAVAGRGRGGASPGPQARPRARRPRRGGRRRGGPVAGAVAGGGGGRLI